MIGGTVLEGVRELRHDGLAMRGSCGNAVADIVAPARFNVKRCE
jgi:hypothetical protein